jgi:hypothetical protein
MEHTMPPPRRHASTTCLHCNSRCVLTKGSEIFKGPEGSKKYGHLNFYVCPICIDSRVGCHPNSDIPLGFAANGETRKARMTLHSKMLDPIWLTAPSVRHKEARGIVYKYLAYMMERDEVHVGEFTLEECREAWLALTGVTFKSIKRFMEELEEEEDA